MRIPAGVIFLWTGTNGGIPAGWIRETSLDSKYLKGCPNGTNPNTTGGSATHSHTSSAHSHSENAHTHTITLGNTTDMAGRAGGTQVWASHGHAAHTSANSTGGSLSSVSSTYSSVSNDPPFKEVIFIRSEINMESLPTNGICFADDTSFTNNGGKWTGFYKCDGANSTTDLNNKFLKGAGTSQDAGTEGGSTTNIHTLSHTHTVTGHTHPAVTSPATAPAKVGDGWGGVPTGGYGTGSSSHTHATSLDSTTPVLSGNPSIVTTETVEPIYRQLLAIQNKGGFSHAPLGIIGIWLGSLASIPCGWILCDGTNGTVDMRDRYSKPTSNPASINSSGGSNTHVHSGNTHGHTSSHTHSATTSQHPNYDDSSYSAWYTTQLGIYNTTKHPVSVGSATSTYANATTNADSASNEPPYRTVAFIKLRSVRRGAAQLL